MDPAKSISSSGLEWIPSGLSMILPVPYKKIILLILLDLSVLAIGLDNKVTCLSFGVRLIS